MLKLGSGGELDSDFALVPEGISLPLKMLKVSKKGNVWKRKLVTQCKGVSTAICKSDFVQMLYITNCCTRTNSFSSISFFFLSSF